MYPSRNELYHNSAKSTMVMGSADAVCIYSVCQEKPFLNQTGDNAKRFCTTFWPSGFLRISGGIKKCLPKITEGGMIVVNTMAD